MTPTHSSQSGGIGAILGAVAPSTRDDASGLLGERRVWAGCAAWCLFAVVAVAVRGVRWEEGYEHALLITRTVVLPDGHPMFQYVRNAFSLQSYLAAAFLYLTDSGLLLCGVRNVLQLVFSTIPVFLWGALLTRHTRWGHLAALLILAGVHKPLESFYPIVPWPHFYATGQIGLGFALLVLWLLTAGYWRSAWCGLALLAGIHLGQLPPLLLLFGLLGAGCLYARRYDLALQAVIAFAAGLAPIAIFALVLRLTHVPDGQSGAYAVAGDGQAIYQAYTALHDLHRTVPRLNAFSYGVLAWFAVASAVLFRAVDSPDRGRYGVLLGYLLALVPFVGGAWLFRVFAPEQTPFLVTGWMPFRLMNHVAVLLVPIGVAVLSGHHCARAHWSRVVLVALALLAALQPALAWVTPAWVYERYLGTQELFLFFLLGAVCAAWPLNRRGIAGVFSGGVFAGGLVLLALQHRFGCFLLVCGALLIAWPRVVSWRPPRAYVAGPALLSAVCALLAVSLLAQEYRGRVHLPIAPIQRDTVAYLAARGEDDALLLTPYWDIEWLGKTRHPIFADYQSAHLMSYMPHLAPVLKAMHEDVYGWTLDAVDEAAPLSTWPTRSPEAWAALAEKYGFRYVLSPVAIPLTLPRILETDPYTLYAIEEPGQSTGP